MCVGKDVASGALVIESSILEKIGEDTLAQWIPNRNLTSLGIMVMSFYCFGKQAAG